MNKVLEGRLAEIKTVAADLGFDGFPVEFDVVSPEIVLELISYSGLPIRPRHWSYGQSYDYQKTTGEMGHSKIYEFVLNGNPAQAYLLDTNPDIIQTMVMAHVVGHSEVFKNNYIFKNSDRQMIYHSAERAKRVDDYIEMYGLDAVEHMMDIGFAIDKHIDWHKGLYREPYARRKTLLRKRKVSEFDDLTGNDNLSMEKIVVNENFPPQPEFDLLWFFINYAQLEDWQKDVLQIIREESFYFYPQHMTKIIHEGTASLAHTEIMSQLKITPADHLEFCKVHERVVQPGSSKLNINPYFLGFTILNDIRKRWDKYHESGESKLNGWEKALDVVKEEDDISFIRNYLSQEVVDDLEMFAYKTYTDRQGNEVMEITSRKASDVAEHLVSNLHNYHAPLICITKASAAGLELEHRSPELGTLDLKHLERVMGYLFEIWHSPVDILAYDDSKEKVHYTFDEMGFSASEEVTVKA